MTDIAIIGAGIAGISAAVTAASRNKSVMIFDDGNAGGKLNAAHEIKNFPGFFGKSQEEIRRELDLHLAGMGISVTPKKITSVYNMGDHFSLISGQEYFEAKKVILASGISFGKPLNGENVFLGRGVSYCATCDGMLYKGKTVAVILYSKKEEQEVSFLSEICTKVLLFPMYKDAVDESILNNPAVEIRSAKNFSISGGMKADTLSADGAEFKTDCVFILRENIPPAQLISGIEMDGNHVKTDRSMKTNIKGFFAAGDITGTPYQYAKASGEGNIAALSACME